MTTHDETTALAPMEGLHLARDPAESLAEASKAAAVLVRMVKEQGLSRRFGGEKEHLFFEAWETIAAWYGVSYGVDSVETIPGEAAPVGFRAHAYAETGNGRRYEATASCWTDEPNWRSKPLFQLESMAQTRAMGKVLRSALGWVAVLAGYSGTPGEEMVHDNPQQQGPQTPRRRGRPPKQTTPESEAAPQPDPQAKEYADRLSAALLALGVTERNKQVETVRAVCDNLYGMAWGGLTGEQRREVVFQLEQRVADTPDEEATVLDVEIREEPPVDEDPQQAAF